MGGTQTFFSRRRTKSPMSSFASMIIICLADLPTANVIGPTFSWRAVRPSRGADLRALTREASVCSTQASSLTGLIFALKTTRASKKRIERKIVTGWWTRQGRPEEKLLAQASVAFQCASNKTFRDFIQSCSVLPQLVHQQIN
ncbi:hypothetical protein KEM48_008111 [Puccinia striiformis f. sp. tritici PST-130]|uniref:Uncharacterized protein n=1 Tax=Puccinia striiformis f. sp. tritici PST-78 TaxID=1165861 RepID=A0A0L0VR92_9BASI|nr:hypothetical protein KEM48_008111 [Puccinia striiformis f. sp. tritici PST-130]KNF01732.1 hypothetical protein PSTG_05159 [Puccinia striiformis f. sp. tritici PST-78]